MTSTMWQFPLGWPKRPKHVELDCANSSDALLMNIFCYRRTVAKDVLQLSGLLAGGVKESRNDNPTGDSLNGGRPNPASSFVRSGGIFAILFRCAMLRD